MGTKFAVPPMFFLTKLDEALIQERPINGGSSSLVLRINGGKTSLKCKNDKQGNQHKQPQ